VCFAFRHPHHTSLSLQLLPRPTHRYERRFVSVPKCRCMVRHVSLWLAMLWGLRCAVCTVPPLLPLLGATPPDGAFQRTQPPQLHHEGVETPLRVTLVVEAAHGGAGRFAGHQTLWTALAQHLHMDMHANVTVAPETPYGPPGRNDATGRCETRAPHTARARTLPRLE
jgi:hypothetical protein